MTIGALGRDNEQQGHDKEQLGCNNEATRGVTIRAT